MTDWARKSPTQGGWEHIYNRIHFNGYSASPFFYIISGKYQFWNMYTYTHPRPRLIPIAFFFTARLSRDQTSLTFVISQESEERWLSFLFISTRDPGGGLFSYTQQHSVPSKVLNLIQYYHVFQQCHPIVQEAQLQVLKEKRQPHSIFNTLLFIDNYTKSFIKDAKVKKKKQLPCNRPCTGPAQRWTSRGICKNCLSYSKVRALPASQHRAEMQQ